MAAWLALTNARCDQPHRSPCDVVTLDVSRHSVDLGLSDHVRAVVRVRPVAGLETADLYVGIALPDGRRLVRDPAGVLTVRRTRHGLSRADRSERMRDAASAGTVFILDVEVGRHMPPGTYEVFAVVAKPTPEPDGEVSLADVVAWALKTVTVTQ
jgi:hypothetical protein